MAFGNHSPAEASPQTALGSPETAPQARKRVRDTSTPEARSRLSRGSAAKGAQGERDVLQAFRDVMRNVEAELTEAGHVFVARSEFATRKRIEKNTSNRDLGNIPLISIEVKRNETLNVQTMWDQAVRQADGGLLPVLVYRRNREPWRVRTWIALTSADGAGKVVRYAVGEISLIDFLPYYASLYRTFLNQGLAI